jgi:hypothetical protein
MLQGVAASSNTAHKASNVRYTGGKGSSLHLVGMDKEAVLVCEKLCHLLVIDETTLPFIHQKY